MLRRILPIPPNAVLLLPWLFALGCNSPATPRAATVAARTASAADTSGAAPLLQAIVASGKLADARWPDFKDYQPQVQAFYQSANYAPAWLRGGQPTPQALAVIAALETSRQKGLNPDDYDAPSWPKRLETLQNQPGNAAAAQFDAALTVAAMRYVSDLHVGRINPKHFKFGIDIAQKEYDLAAFLSQDLVGATDVPHVLDEVEPPYDGYRRTEAALQTYLKLAAQEQDQGQFAPLPETPKAAVAPGDAYASAGPLAQRLRLRGDLPQAAAVDPNSGIYAGALVDAVKHFQTRHGIAPNGKLGKETLRQLNTPLSVRVTQLSDALERWRWLPENFSPLPVAVNIPEFVLRVFNPDRTVAMRMNVVVGRALRSETPAFADAIQYIVFRPYWNVPPSIARGEIVPGIQKDPGYLAKKNMEITDSAGKVVTAGAASPEVLAQLRAGRLMVRQRPGPKNSLGLIKFIFPNSHNVYLHSTPATELFERSRRDFSHGCIRVQQPAELAAFLLRSIQANGQPKWTLAAVKAAMQSGPDNQQVNLNPPVPVVIVYMTAVVEEDGEVYFFDDIYGHDKTLNAELAKGPPYP
jgi:murein L,D-transpeptidase YcbB/YkuD